MTILRKAARHSPIRALILGAAVWVAGCGGTDAADPSQVATESGPVRGTVLDGKRAFLGIPYAAPPVGPLRWRPPQQVGSWATLRDATALGSPCSQPITDAAGKPAVRGDEDCLVLDVYAPTAPATPRPVIVFLHGGAFRNGTGGDYDAGEFARKGDIVVVTVNFRLGVFGFLAHPGLAAEAADNASGQYGLLDQRFALGWVRRNIAAFGGDPDNITLAGESSGAYSACNHLASPPAAGLFAKVILQSGACSSSSTALPQAQAEAAGIAFATQVGCAEVGCLRGLAATALANAPATERIGSTAGWAPALGGTTLPRASSVVLRAGEFHPVPVLIGSNREEYRVFTALQELGQGAAVSAAQYNGLVAATFGAGASAVLGIYPLTAYAAPNLAQSALFTDLAFACPTQTSANLFGSRVAAWAYEFDDPSAPIQVPGPFITQRSYHGSELPYLFVQRQSQFGFGAVAALSMSQQVLADRMIAHWAAFAASGDPNVDGALNWPRYTAAAPVHLRLAPEAVVVRSGFAAEHRCEFWAGFGV